MNDLMIRCFTEVVKNNSFTKAADNLFMSQQAVSKHVKHLEELVGYDLLKRSTRHVELTPIGEEFYQVFLKWEYDFEAVQSRAELMRTNGRRLRIGMVLRMWSGKVPLIVRTMKAEHPDYLFSVTHMEPQTLNEKLLDDELDLIITYEDFLSDLMKKQTKKEAVGETKFCLCLASDHPLATDELNRREMEKLPLLVCVEKNENRKLALEKAMTERRNFGLGDGIVKLYQDINEVNTLVELGEGFCFCSETNIFVKNPLVRVYYLDKVTKICAIWKKDRKLALVDEFFDTAKHYGDIREMIV